MSVFGSVLQIVGIAVVAAGGWLLAPFVGVVAAGVGIFAVGFQLERLYGGSS